MNEKLFKLKKDGKTVGYLKFKDGKFIYSNEDGSYVSPYCISIWNGKVFSFQCPAYGSSYYEHDECEYDSIHPFVTKDKNGKDVFEWDKVKANGIIAILTLDVRQHRYMLSTIPNQSCYPPALYDYMGTKFSWSDIELIEEEQ